MLTIKDIMAIARDDESMYLLVVMADSMKADGKRTLSELQDAKQRRKRYARLVQDRIERKTD